MDASERADIQRGVSRSMCEMNMLTMYIYSRIDGRLRETWEGIIGGLQGDSGRVRAASCRMNMSRVNITTRMTRFSVFFSAAQTIAQAMRISRTSARSNQSCCLLYIFRRLSPILSIREPGMTHYSTGRHYLLRPEVRIDVLWKHL